MLVADRIAPTRDVHVAFARGGRTLIASVWSVSGDAGIVVDRAAPTDAVTLRELLGLLEEHVLDVVRYLEANRSA